MAIEFRNVTLGCLNDFSAAAPGGVVIGIIGARDSGQAELLRIVGGVAQTFQGELNAGGCRRYLSGLDALDLTACDVLAVDHTFASHDALARAKARVALDQLRANDATVLLASHEAELIRHTCDEVWWLDQGRLVRRGDPVEVWTAYLERIASQLRQWGATQHLSLSPTFRRGDGRAEVVSLETRGADGHPTMVWRSGEQVSIRAAIRYNAAVDDPVIGIMIRTRVGSEVYGTNTELEQVKIGPCAADDIVRIAFSFRCDLCNNEYTVTLASHDPDGTAHDWMDDAVAFTVADSRYTAGVANLRASVSVERNAATVSPSIGRVLGRRDPSSPS